MNSPNISIILLCILTSLLVLKHCSCSDDRKAIEDDDSNYENPTKHLSRSLDEEVTGLSRSRQKRNIIQLGTQLVRSTRFSPIKLAHYGNWCGRGGDRKGDGSYIDGCDLCCKKHDLCFHDTRVLYPGCNPRAITYKARFLKDKDHGYCIDEDCAQETCICDVKFIVCMQKEPCPPLKVFNSVSYFWWLGVGL